MAMDDCATCGHPSDPDAQHCQTPDCECRLYATEGGDICPECDHDIEEHDAAGCREWTPTWPRLVRCGCKLSYGLELTENQIQELANEAEQGYGVEQLTQLITSEWQEHRLAWEVLARSSADEPWTRLEGFDRGPLMKRAREIAYPDSQAAT